MGDDCVPKTGPRSWTEINYTFWHSGFFKNFDELRGNRRRITGRLQNYGVSADDRGQRHAGHNCTRKIPRRNDGSNPERNVEKIVTLARQLHRSLDVRESQRLTRIKLTEVNRLSDVGICLGPIFAYFKHQPCHEFEFAVAQQVGGSEKQIET